MNKNRQPDNVNKAQGDISPELSSVFKEMKNGFDIQPLDDVPQDEFVSFEYDVTASDQTEETKDSQKKEKTEFFNPDPAKKEGHKKLTRAGIVVALIVCVIAALYITFFHLDDFGYGAVAVYEKNSEVNILLENNDTIQLNNVEQLNLSDDGKVLVYSQHTDAKTGKYDIRVVDFSKRTSVKNKGSIIVSGIEENWYMEKSGSFVYYSKAENGSIKYYCFSTEEHESEMIVADATEFFAPPMGDIAYYTRERADTTMLYRKRFGEETESLGDVSNIKAAKSDTVMELFFTTDDKNKKDGLTLYKISGSDTKVKVSDNVSEAYLDDYTPGGNLYYFVKNEAALNWNDFVEDPYQDADFKMEKPDKSDFLVTVGFFFKRTVLDEKAYNRAMAEYNKKLTRDKVRSALDELDLGLAVSTEYKVKVYDGQISKELANSVKLENLIAFAKTGAPRIIFKTTGIDSSQKINMNKLYEIAHSKTVDDAIDYVVSTISEDYEISTGNKYSWYDGSKVLTYDFDPEADVSDCTFDFVGRNNIVTSVISGSTVSSLYISKLNGKDLAKPELISDDVISFTTNGNNLYYEKINGETDTLYVYSSEGETVEICESCVEYFTLNEDETVAFKGAYDNGILLSAEIVLHSQGKTKTIDKNVSPGILSIDGNTFAYVKNYRTAAATDTQAQTGGELMLYSDGKTKSLDSDVILVYAINN